MVQILIPEKEVQKRIVRHRLEELANESELTEESFEALIERYANAPRMKHARRYAKRLRVLWRAGILRRWDVRGQKWELIEKRAASVWINNEGELIPRHLQDEITSCKMAERLPPKRERPLCAATRKDGKPCQARAVPYSTLCNVHRPKLQ
jgi:hypothetical protein